MIDAWYIGRIGVLGVFFFSFFISTHLQLNGCQLINTTIYAILQHILSTPSARAGLALSATAEQPSLPYQASHMICHATTIQ